MIRASIRTLDWRGWTQALVREIDRAIEQTARYVPIDVSERIYAETTPEGTSQINNSPLVAQRKLKTLGHAIPLLASGRLADASGWIVDQIPAGWRVRPPVGRAQIIVYLREKGYRLFEVSDSILERLERELGAALDRAEAAISQFTTERVING